MKPHRSGRGCLSGRRVLNLSALVERIAGFDTARIEATSEPQLALGGAAVRKTVRHHLPGAFFLQGIVANGRSRSQNTINVARLKNRMALVGLIEPDPGKTVCLQFQTHGQGIRLFFTDSILAGTIHF